jgi:hypothetical protein
LFLEEEQLMATLMEPPFDFAFGPTEGSGRAKRPDAETAR